MDSVYVSILSRHYVIWVLFCSLVIVLSQMLDVQFLKFRL